jgi:hypothetical protein
MVVFGYTLFCKKTVYETKWAEASDVILKVRRTSLLRGEDRRSVGA